MSCPQSYFPYQSINPECNPTSAEIKVVPQNQYYNNYSTNCGHRCCYEQYLKQKQKEFEQFYCSAQVQQRELKVAATKHIETKATTTSRNNLKKPIKVDKATDTFIDMNRPDSPPSLASSASPPPAPPPLPIAVRAAYCARCRFNIEHSRHDLSSSQSHLLNGSTPANNYGIPRASYTGEIEKYKIFEYIWNFRMICNIN